MPPSIAVRRSVRLHGDTKTEKSRRALALPQNAVAALREHRHHHRRRRHGQDLRVLTGRVSPARRPGRELGWLPLDSGP